MRRAVGAVLDLAGLGLLDGPADVRGDGADLRVRHLALRAEDAARGGRRPASCPGVAIATSKSVKPSSTRWARSSAPTTSAPAASASAALSPWAKTATVTSLPSPCGQRDRAAQLLVGVADVQPGADVDLDRLVELGALELLDAADRLGGLVLALAVDRSRSVSR